MARRNRRGKNDKSQSKDVESAANNSSTIEQGIARAQAAVEQARHSTCALHAQWRLHLVRLSYMLVLVSMHQLQAPATYCLYDIKSYNKSLTPLDDPSMKVSGLQALKLVLLDNMCEVLAVAMGACLTLFLTQMHAAEQVVLINTSAKRDSFFTNVAYMVATGLVPPVLNFYFHRSKSDVKSCMDSVAGVGDRMFERYTEHEDSMASKVRGFPVVVVFHTIATACCWFIEMQQSQQNRNIRMIEGMKRDLVNSQDSKKKS